MIGTAFSSGGIISVLLLLFGVVLTAITMLRMRSGKIAIPAWGKILLSIAMIVMLLILVIGMLPPKVIQVEDFFVEEDTYIVTPEAPETTQAAP